MLSSRFNKMIKKQSGLCLVTDQSQFQCMSNDYVEVMPNGTGIFEKKVESWGTCSVPITIYLTAKSGLPPRRRIVELQHQVSFDNKGKWKAINIKIDKDAALKLGIK